MKIIPITSSVRSLAALALVTGCVPGSEHDGAESSESGTETLDGAADDDDIEFRTYEGAISNPSYGLPVRTGTTAGKTHEFSPTCGYSNAAPDVSYTWTAPSTATYTISTAGSSYDTILHVRSFTNSAQTLACNDNTNNSVQSSVSLALTQGTTIIIVVDGYASQAGAFELNITKGAPCPDNCKNPPTQCHASTGGCIVDPFAGTSSCWYPPVPTGFQCDDGNLCSTGSHCANYSCVPDAFYICNQPPNDCFETWGACDWPQEACVYFPKVSGAPCDDGLGCTTGDACNGQGTCVPQNDFCGPDPSEECDPTTESCGGWPVPEACDPTSENCPTQELGVLDPRGFATTPASAEPPPFETLDVEAFMALERELRAQAQ